MSVIYISVGSNINKEENIPSALKELSMLFTNVTISSLYECAAVGFNGPEFYNLVLKADTHLSVDEVVNLCKAMEVSHGRPEHAQKNTPRTLDLDLVLYDDLVIETPAHLPRPEILTSAFVLWPLSEVAPAALHPVIQQPFAKLWQQFDQQSQPIRKLPLPWRI